jgi:hypothetical protein
MPKTSRVPPPRRAIAPAKLPTASTLTSSARRSPAIRTTGTSTARSMLMNCTSRLRPAMNTQKTP